MVTGGAYRWGIYNSVNRWGIHNSVNNMMHVMMAAAVLQSVTRSVTVAWMNAVQFCMPAAAHGCRSCVEALGSLQAFTPCVWVRWQLPGSLCADRLPQVIMVSTVAALSVVGCWRTKLQHEHVDDMWISCSMTTLVHMCAGKACCVLRRRGS